MSILDNAKDIAELIKKYNDQELYQRIVDLRDEIFELKEENRKLKGDLIENQSWTEKSKRYELIKTQGGAVVYKSKAEPAHFICPRCFEKKEIQILQDRKVVSGIHDCPNCKASFPVDKEKELGGEMFQVHNKWDVL